MSLYVFFISQTLWVRGIDVIGCVRRYKYTLLSFCIFKASTIKRIYGCVPLRVFFTLSTLWDSGVDVIGYVRRHLLGTLHCFEKL